MHVKNTSRESQTIILSPEHASRLAEHGVGPVRVEQAVEVQLPNGFREHALKPRTVGSSLTWLAGETKEVPDTFLSLPALQQKVTERLLRVEPRPVEGHAAAATPPGVAAETAPASAAPPTAQNGTALTPPALPPASAPPADGEAPGEAATAPPVPSAAATPRETPASRRAR